MSAITGVYPTNRGFSVTTASQLALPANPVRNFLIIQNLDDTNNLYFTLDGSAASPSAGSLKCPPGAAFSFGMAVPRGQVRVIADTGTISATICDG